MNGLAFLTLVATLAMAGLAFRFGHPLVRVFVAGAVGFFGLGAVLIFAFA